SGNNTFFMKGTYSSSWSYAFQTVAGNNDVRLFVASPTNDAGSNLVDTNGGNLTASAWRHIAIVYDGSLTNANRVKVYFEGSNQPTAVTGTIPTTLGDDSGSFYLGT